MQTSQPTSFGDTLEFAESLGWEDIYPDATDPNYDGDMADGIEQDALDHIEDAGYEIMEPRE